MYLDERVESGVFEIKLKRSNSRFDERNDGYRPYRQAYGNEFDSRLHKKSRFYGNLNESLWR